MVAGVARITDVIQMETSITEVAWQANSMKMEYCNGKSSHLFREVRRPGPGDGHVALHGDGGHGEDRRHDGHVGHEVCHPAEDQSEYPVPVNIDI